MAEFFHQCILQIKQRLGKTDSELDEGLTYLNEITRDCIKNDTFIKGAPFTLETSPDFSLSDYFLFLDRYFECSSLSKVDLFFETSPLQIAISDADIDILTMKFPNLKTIKLNIVKGQFTDKSVEFLTMRCPYLQWIEFYNQSHDSGLTDASFQYLATLKKLVFLTVQGMSQITDNGLIALSSSSVEALTMTADKQISDNGIKGFKNMLMLTMNGSHVTTSGILAMLKNNPKLVTLYLLEASLDSSVLEEVCRSSKIIMELVLPGCIVSKEVMQSIELPKSLLNFYVCEPIEVNSNIQIGTMQIYLLSGKSLPAMDPNGLSDPYVVFRMNRTKARSKIIYKNLNPVWNEVLVIPGCYLDELLVVEVWDKDVRKKDDLMARGEYSVEGLEEGETKTITMAVGKGSIQFQLQFVPGIN